MVVEDFHLICPLLRPTEAQAVLLVDANAVLSLPVTGEGFEAITGRAFEVDKIGCGMKDEQFGSRPSAKICGKRPGRVSQKELLGFLAVERANRAMSNYTGNQRTARQNVLDFGTEYREEFEERMESVIREASTEPRPILFIDEIHLLLGAGQAGGSMDAAIILKPALARGTIRLIGATTSKEYR